MIVDDDPLVRDFVCTSLYDDGLNVCEAANGKDALLQMNNGTDMPDLILVDVMMSNMDGFELCQYLRHFYKELPLIMLTEKKELPHEHKGKGIEHNADDYLAKPFDESELIIRVRALLYKYRIDTPD